jgi:hypothetical protein
VTDIISRRTWRAKPPKGRTPARWRKGVNLWVHHSESPAPKVNASIAEESQVMRNIQSFHMGPSRGWSDIGYHYCIMPSGRIYEGRGPDVMGAHCPGHNDEPSVCFIGSYDTKLPTNDALRSLNDLRGHLSAGRLKGHRDGYSTSCPGNALYKRIKLPLPAPHGKEEPGKEAKRTARLVIGKREWVGWPKFRGAVRWVAKNGIKRGTKAEIEWGGQRWTGSKQVSNVAKNIYSRFIEEEL